MKIMLVDDVEHALNRLKIAVGEVCPADDIQAFSNPAEALQFAKSFIPDITFLDIQMDGMNGIALGKCLKEINPSMRLVFCTGYSEYAYDAMQMHASGYLMKPIAKEDILREIEAMSQPLFTPNNRTVVIKTFGNFEIFVNGTPVAFKRNRSKEVLAIIVDHNGATVRAEEIADLLWEDGQYGPSRQHQLYTIISDLRHSLASLGAEKILIKRNKGYAIDKTLVDCDYFHLCDGDASVLNTYKGKYMYEYSWAEFSVARIEKTL